MAKKSSFQELSTEPEEGEQQEPKQGVHTVQGLLQPIQTQAQQVGVCVEHRCDQRSFTEIFHLINNCLI